MSLSKFLQGEFNIKMKFRYFVLLLFTGIVLAGVLIVQSLNINISGYTRSDLSTYVYWQKKPDIQMVQATLASGADVNEYSEYGWTPIMFAIQTYNTDIVTALVNAGADINAIAEDSSTPLIQAIITAQNTDMIKTLLDLGADIRTTDKHGRIALYYALQNTALKDTDIIPLLTP